MNDKLTEFESTDIPEALAHTQLKAFEQRRETVIDPGTGTGNQSLEIYSDNRKVRLEGNQLVMASTNFEKLDCWNNGTLFHHVERRYKIPRNGM